MVQRSTLLTSTKFANPEQGVKTNIPFLMSLLTHPTFIEGRVWTTFIDVRRANFTY